MGNTKTGTRGGITPLLPNKLESNYITEDQGILMEKFTMIQQCALIDKNIHGLLGWIRWSVVRMLGEMRNPSSYPLEHLDSL